MSDAADFAAQINQMPDGWAKCMGIHFVSASRDEVRAELVIGAQHRQPYGVVHGGVYAGLIETVASVGGALFAMEQGLSVVGLDNHTNFLRATRQGKLQAVATPVLRGRRTHLWNVAVYDEKNREVASGRVRLMVLEPGATLAGEMVGISTDSSGSSEPSE